MAGAPGTGDAKGRFKMASFCSTVRYFDITGSLFVCKLSDNEIHVFSHGNASLYCRFRHYSGLCMYPSLVCKHGPDIGITTLGLCHACCPHIFIHFLCSLYFRHVLFPVRIQSSPAFCCVVVFRAHPRTPFLRSRIGLEKRGRYRGNQTGWPNEGLFVGSGI